MALHVHTLCSYADSQTLNFPATVCIYTKTLKMSLQTDNFKDTVHSGNY